jgi:hypothetical protein
MTHGRRIELVVRQINRIHDDWHAWHFYVDIYNKILGRVSS